MQKPNRPTKRSGKYLKRPIITTNDPQKSEAFYNATDADAPLDPRQFVAGVIQHPVTHLYQTWLSTNGLDVTCVSAHHDVKRAEADLQEVKTLIRSGDLYDDEKASTLFHKLKSGSDEEPQALPDDLVRRIVREILRTVVDGPQQPKL